MNVYYILLITAFFSLVLASIFIFSNKINRASTLFLAFYYFLISINSFQIFILESNLLAKFSWFYGWPLLLFILTPIVLVAYFIKSLELSDKKCYLLYVLLFIPFVIALVDTLQWVFNDSAQRQAIISSVIENPSQRFKLSYGFFKLKTHILIRNTISVIAMFTLLPIIINSLKNKSKSPEATIFNKWLLSFWILVTLKFIIWSLWSVFWYIEVDFMSSFIQQFSPYIVLFFAIVTLAIGVVPFYFPTILYSYTIGQVFDNSANQSPNNEKTHTHKTIPSSERYVFDKSKMRVKLNEIEKLKLYLSTDYDSSQLANQLQIPIHQLSSLLNDYFNMSFSDYRNNLRMQHAISLIDNGYLIQNTTEALALECGFASRSSFSKNFKNTVGLSPGAYHKSVQ